MRSVPALVATCLLLSCEARRETDKIVAAPSTYTGTLPCAGCPGLRLTLDLRPDGTYQLSRTYLQAEHGRDRSFVHQGRWSLARDQPMLILDGGPVELRRLAVEGPRTLRVLDHDLRKIETM